MDEYDSIPDVLDVHVFRGSAAVPSAPIDLLLEVPHGAEGEREYGTWAERLDGPHPADLIAFFHCNTDVGAAAVAMEVAEGFVAREPGRVAVVARCRIPRTFIDVNRVIDARPEDYRAGGVTPGLMPWVVTDRDRSMLLAAYEAYTARIDALVGRMAPDGAMMMVHTYSPRTVDVQVDADIVPNLRRAWSPEVWSTWPERPEFDIIARAPDGRILAPLAVIAALRAAFAPAGHEVATSATYPLHPSTMAWRHVVRCPERTLCLEVRRDLLVRELRPFDEMPADPARVAPIAEAVVEAARAGWWPPVTGGGAG